MNSGTWNEIQKHITLTSLKNVEKMLHKMCDLHTVTLEDVLLMLHDPNPETLDDIRKVKLRRYGISVVDMADRISAEASSRGLRLSSAMQGRIEYLRTLVREVYHE